MNLTRHGQRLDSLQYSSLVHQDGICDHSARAILQSLTCGRPTLTNNSHSWHIVILTMVRGGRAGVTTELLVVAGSFLVLDRDVDFVIGDKLWPLACILSNENSLLFI